MDEQALRRLKALLSCPLGQLNLGDAMFAMMAMDDMNDAEVADLVGYTPPAE